MSSFISGLMSVGRKLGGVAKDWAQGTNVGRAIDKGRNIVGSFNQKKPNQAGGTDSSSNGTQDA